MVLSRVILPIPSRKCPVQFTCWAFATPSLALYSFYDLIYIYIYFGDHSILQSLQLDFRHFSFPFTTLAKLILEIQQTQNASNPTKFLIFSTKRSTLLPKSHPPSNQKKITECGSIELKSTQYEHKWKQGRLLQASHWKQVD